MITVGVIRNGGTYLSQHLRKNDYWAEGEKQVCGQWIGQGATLLGLEGAVTDAPFEALRPLSAAGINLTRIESRPSRRRRWEYVFFLDLEGHRAEPAVAQALAALAAGRTLRVLGSYRKADET